MEKINTYCKKRTWKIYLLNFSNAQTVFLYSYHPSTWHCIDIEKRDCWSLTSGSDVSSLVWMRIFPILTSLHTDSRAGSIVSPARSIDTPHSWKKQSIKFIFWEDDFTWPVLPSRLRFSYKEVQLKKFCLAVKVSPAKNIDETLEFALMLIIRRKVVCKRGQIPTFSVAYLF